VLGEVLDTLLRLLHPMMPFVTETLWTVLTGDESLVIASWPAPDQARVDADPDATRDVATIQAVVTEVRRFRSDQGVKPSQRPTVRIAGVSASSEPAIRALARLAEPGEGFAPTASMTTAGGARLEFDLSGVIDVVAERARLTKDRTAAEKERAANAAKLGNEAFIGRAPDAVVAKVRDRLAAAQADLLRIDAALQALPPS
jgi:valyl-tRNA synthetase